MRAEAALHQEVIWRLKAAKPDCIVIPIPNGIWLPARSEAERVLVARLIAKMKSEGQLLPGVADLLVLWRDGCGCIELKAPVRQTLFGKRQAGRPSDAQLAFQALCETHGVKHVYASSWEEVKAALQAWGRLG